jgi:hypothetical protein
MAQIEDTPFLLNTRYGCYNKENKIVLGRYFKILEVTKDETEEDLSTESGKIRAIEVTIEYKKGADIEPMVINRASIIKKSEDDKYTLFKGRHGGILIPSLVVSTEPLPDQDGGYRNRKSTKKVRRRRRNKTTGRRSTY